MTKDINSDVFSEETKLKLDIFRKCFREWYPVFLHNQYISHLFVFDFFAGSGKDSEGYLGSPLILLQEAKGNGNKHCKYLSENQKPSVIFRFNEKIENKSRELKQNIEIELKQCSDNCTLNKCLYSNSYYVDSYDFQELIQEPEVCSILKNKNYGKFILLDQYGFKQINDKIFLQLVDSPKTDFIFFIASSFIKRFKELPAVAAYFDNNKISFDESQPKECHRVITDYFRSLIPDNKEYYLHSFTIQKGTNYYGLIFGTNHSLGMEKFLKVCWQEDNQAGESNCNINNDYERGTLFYDEKTSRKKELVSKLIKEQLLSGKIRNNIDGLKFTLMNGCEGKLFVDNIAEMKDDKIEIDGIFNRTSTNIHKAPEYKIRIK